MNLDTATEHTSNTELFCDLHLHSNVSDGSFVPAQVVRFARENGMRAIALTDHDSVAGLDEARAEAERLELTFLNGVEISTNCEGREIHLLGYGFDPLHAGLCELLQRLTDERKARIPKIVARLNELGIALKSERVFEIAKQASPGRPHVAQALVELGVCKSTQDAFEHYLFNRGPAYVPRSAASAQEGIRIVHEAGGVVSFAHPGITKNSKLGTAADFRKILIELCNAGLDALEIDHPTHLPSTRRKLRKLAREFSLLETGGSDFHGAASPGVFVGRGRGDLRIPLARFEALVERIATKQREQQTWLERSKPDKLNFAK